MSYLKDHTLYYKKTCPFCQKVLRFMDEKGITLDMRDTTQPGIQNDLVCVGGKAMYESDDIIAYLATQVG